MKNEWLPGITNEQHHAMDAISSTKLKIFYGEGPDYYNKKYNLKLIPSPKESKNFRDGTNIHELILEEDKFRANTIVFDGDLRTKKGKEELDFKIKQIPSGSQKIKIIDTETLNMYQSCADSVNSNLLFKELQKCGIVELSGTAIDPITGLAMCIRGDLKFSRGFIDVKTIDELTPKNIQNHIIDFYYWMQVAHYLECANIIDNTNQYKEFWFMFVEKKAPFRNHMFQLDEVDIDFAKRIRRKCLDEIAKCKKSGIWPSYQKETFSTLPNYAFNNYFEMMKRG